MRQKKRAILLGVIFAIICTVKLSEYVNPTVGIIVGPLLGIGLGYVVSKKVSEDTKIDLQGDGSDLVHSGAANHIKKGVSVGGELYLLKDRLEFKTHSFNLSDEHLIIKINEINTLEFYNNLGIVKNGLKVINNDGSIQKFVLNNRQIWHDEIMKLKS